MDAFIGELNTQGCLASQSRSLFYCANFSSQVNVLFIDIHADNTVSD